jgi:sarcosine oxidase subunit gamma
MAEASRRESPLARVRLARQGAAPRAAAGVVVRERVFLGHLNLRGKPDDAHFTRAVSAVLGGDLPLQPNTVREAGDTTVFWLGPDEWLILTADGRGDELVRALRAALAGAHAGDTEVAGAHVAVTDVSGGQTVLSLSGPAVRDLLAKGCPLDLHPRAFGIGRCAQSHLAKAPLLLRLADGTPTFELIIRRSFSDYVWAWLDDAAAEFGLELAQ